MNAAGPSTQTPDTSAPQSRGDSPASSSGQAPISEAKAQVQAASTLAVHPLVWAIQLWVLASLASLLLSAGLARALRGAFVGAEPWIIRIDHSAALTSQVAAICTALLLVYMGMLSVRAARSPLIGIGAALLGSAPTIILFYSHRLILPQAHGWIAALCGSAALALCATQARSNKVIRTVVTLGGLSLFAAALRAGGLNGTGTPLLSEVGSALRVLLAWGTLLTTLGWHLWMTRTTPLRGSLLLGGAVLLTAAAHASTQPGVSTGVLLIGRSLTELAPTTALGPTGPLLFSLSLLLVLSTLLRWPGSLGQLICALLALSCAAPTTPLVTGWITLCGFSSVVICWVPDPAISEVAVPTGN